jgi:hypothetical protein
MTKNVIGAVIGIAMVTTLVLNGRATPRAIDAVFALVTNPLKTIMGN